MSYNPSHRKYCGCTKCGRVMENVRRKRFLHMGNGLLTEEQMNALPDGTNLDVMTVFREIGALEIWAKPEDSIWFSCGSWAYDRYRDNPSAHESDASGEQKERSHRFIVVDDPENILEVGSIDETRAFYDRYAVDVPDAKTRDRNITKKKLSNSLRQLDRLKVTQQIVDQCAHYGIPYDVLVGLIVKACEREDCFSTKALAAALLTICPGLQIDEKFMPSAFEMSFYQSPVDLMLDRTCRLQEFYNFHLLDALAEKKDTFRRDPHVIDWEKVRADGWYGVFFNFRDIEHIVPPDSPYDWYEFRWHSGYDVESLIVWDRRALLGKLSVQTLSF